MSQVGWFSMKFRFASMDFDVFLLVCDLENVSNFTCDLATRQVPAHLRCLAS